MIFAKIILVLVSFFLCLLSFGVGQHFEEWKEKDKRKAAASAILAFILCILTVAVAFIAGVL